MPDIGAEPLYQRQPDAETQDTFYGQPFTWRWPEQLLIAAIIQDAVSTFDKQPRNNGDYRQWRDDRDWFLDVYPKYTFSFGQCCLWLGIDKNYVLKKLKVKHPRVFK